MIEDYIKTGKLSDREVSIIIMEAEKYKKNAAKATLSGRKKKEPRGYVNEKVRISNTFFPDATEAYKTFNILQSTIIQEYANKKLGVADISEIQYVYYPLGGKFDWHQDVIGLENNKKLRGLTFSVNLSDSDAYEGGNLTLKLSETKTVNLSREKGSYIIFPSFIRHRVDEVTRGSREAIVVWSYLTQAEINSIK